MRPTAPLGCALFLCLSGCTAEILVAEGSLDDVDGGVPPIGPDALATDTPTPDAAPPQDRPLAAALRIRAVELFQTVGVPLARDGAAVSPRNAPVIEGADAMFAIYVDVDASFTARPIEARVTLDGIEYTAEHEITGSSGDTPDSALQITVPGEAISVGSEYAVSLHEVTHGPAVGAASDARYPAEGAADLDVLSPNGELHLVLVPFRYNADGSGRLPPTDDAAASFYEAFKAIFPVADVQLTVREPVNMNMSLATSDGWSAWLDLLRQVRSFDDPPDNTYYYGISAPASSFSGYCNGGCIAGLGHVPSASNTFLFASVGVSFDDALGAGTAVHEVGHTMGRNHAPCGGASGVDSQYPYQGASIGTWGYDARGGALKSPSQYTDVMGYCRAQWISDYQFASIFNRIRTVNNFAPARVGETHSYRVGLVDGDGHIDWRRETTLAAPPAGGDIRVSLQGDDGSELGTADGHFFPYDHLDGGVVYVPIEDDSVPAAFAPTGLTLAN
jgi:hypothetical protein